MKNLRRDNRFHIPRNSSGLTVNFMPSTKTKRPYIIINCAMSADGKIALASMEQTQISCKEDLVRVHRLRNSVDAVLVGKNTVLSDDPSLLVKEEYLGEREMKGKRRVPTRIVLSSTGDIPLRARVLDGTAPTIIVVSEKCRLKRLRNTELLRCGREMVDIHELLPILSKRRIRRMLVEGGGTVIWSFLKDGLFDELHIYVGSMVIGGGAPTPAEGDGVYRIEDALLLKLRKVQRVGTGVLLSYAPR